MSSSGSNPPAEASSKTSPSKTAVPPQRSTIAESPLQTHGHPFLRKLQSGGLSATGSSAFSTTADNGSSNNNSGRKSVDEAIAAVAAESVGDKSPTAAAASAAEIMINRRLHQQSLDNAADPGTSSTAQGSAHVHSHDGGCCSTATTGEAQKHTYEYVSDHESFDLESAKLPPISAEARRFTDQLLGQNKTWAAKVEMERPGFFARLEKQQSPQVLWIGCSDSRVPANQIVNMDPGEIFVHRNIANVVTHTDMNLLSVLEYAVTVLKVRHIIVCGHYGCGGVAASLTQKQYGVIDNWLRNIKDLYTIHRKKFDALPHGGTEQQDLLTELNVIQSALNVCHTSIIQKAWSRGEELSIHGWCYRLSDGRIRNLGLCIEGPGNVEDVYHVQKP
ncbi:hypothetical protein BGZ99_008552 [Dissophora globulifera]|uniref:Carbonic anhydrase n=1 Tax=Dissophora globulifera TaxID=979702 RepID=A0A9P6RS11_9FUNG|nr:hypothetical protein BGZ99_008552 [Dissophora globulifera]